MVLRIRVVNAGFLREAVQAVLVAGSGMAIIIWCPEYFAVQSVFAERMPEGENPTTLLKIAPESFSFYDSTDGHFNAAIEAADLDVVFNSAKDSDPIEFSQSFEDNGVNGYGYLNARFNRPVGFSSGAFMNDYIPMKIHGILPEGVAKSADISHDPSPIPLPPVATFRANYFAQCMATLKNFGLTVLVTALENEVFFSKQGRPLDPLVMTQLTGLISTREDCRLRPIMFYIHMQNLELQPVASLSDEVSLFKRSEKVVLIWFHLAETRTLLKGDFIHYLY